LFSELLDKFEMANYLQVNKVVTTEEEAKKENVKNPPKVWAWSSLFTQTSLSTCGRFYLKTNTAITLLIIQEH
jgi:hypothetical protein